MKGTSVKVSVPVTTFKTEETITISGITKEDALVLLAIHRSVGGVPEGPRGASERFLGALEQAGVKFPSHSSRPYTVNEDVFPTMKGSIRF